MPEATQHSNKLTQIVSLLIVIALGVSLAKLMWLIFTKETKIDIKMQNNPVTQSKHRANQRENYGKVISEQHLFGEIKKVPVKNKARQTEKTEKVKATRLNLKLHGIIAYTNKKGFALISSNGGAQKVYGRGDSIEDQVTVKDLLPGKVILNNHGKIEELVLPRNTVKKGAPAPTRSNSMYPARNNRPGNQYQNPANGIPANAPPQNAPPQFAAPPGARSFSTDLSSFRSEAMKNPAKLMEVIQPSPALIDGKFIGFNVTPGSNTRLFNEIGLEPGDIVTAVNGINLDSASKGSMVLNELSHARSVTLEVIRDEDETITLHKSF